MIRSGGREDDDGAREPGDEVFSQRRGTLDQEYAIYAAQAEAMGLIVKPFDEWLNS